SIGQNLYTPKHITLAAQPLNDRPWAGFLYGSAGLVTVRNNFVDSVEATLGVVGPAALGEGTQKFVHKYISNSPAPQGWGNQLKNEPALMLSWERSWPSRYGTEALGWTAAAVPHLGATLGNVYTYANAGLTFSLTPYEGRFQDHPIRVRPAMPGTGAFVVPEQVFNWYLFGGVETRAVARNIFLDGNTVADSYSIDKKPFVADFNAGLAITYGKTRLSYALVYRTKEFEVQDDGDVFGTISLGFRF
ncbi:MAG: lipid A deacylase LpxR family protein, partial [Alphaproteobacteria bacterium]|nr:lipid A deacylase LpxR family protein [Alphaproteobacteria bacterium]